jgi:hypothetical protein
MGVEKRTTSGSDGELLAKVVQSKDFFQSAIVSDIFEDWNLVKELGEFLVRVEPDSEIMGHALLARANRHLGNLQRAVEELQQCRARVANRELKQWEKEMFLQLFEKEEKLQSGEP